MRQRYRTTPERITEMASVEAMLALYKREDVPRQLFLPIATIIFAGCGQG
jgi:hypothetical protein